MKKKVLIALMIIDAMLLAAAGLADLLLIFVGASTAKFNAYDYINLVAQGIVAILAVYYMLSGCKKGEGTVYYKWFMITFAFLSPISMLQSQNFTSASLILLTLCFGTLCVLCLGKDLGKKVSLLLAVLVLVCSGFMFLTTGLKHTIEGLDAVLISTKVVLAISALLMVLAKYQDKAERGSK